MSDEITLTCKMGVFTFDKNVILSRAKLIRDEVMGQFFTPKPNLPRVRTEQEAQEFARNHLGKTLEAIPFGIRISDDYSYKRKEDE